jgi:DNA-binding CsgD family transcriptional regulator
MAFYSEIIRPVGSRAYLTGVMKVADQTIGLIQLGRASATFDERSLERLSRVLPLLALGEYVRKPRGPSSIPLSPRERDIVEYLALGFTNEDIARGCGTSAHTVRNQLYKLYRKLGVSSRAELVGLLRR